jgi:hypothetical protein
VLEMKGFYDARFAGIGKRTSEEEKTAVLFKS